MLRTCNSLALDIALFFCTAEFPISCSRCQLPVKQVCRTFAVVKHSHQCSYSLFPLNLFFTRGFNAVSDNAPHRCCTTVNYAQRYGGIGEAGNLIILKNFQMYLCESCFAARLVPPFWHTHDASHWMVCQTARGLSEERRLIYCRSWPGMRDRHMPACFKMKCVRCNVYVEWAELLLLSCVASSEFLIVSRIAK